MSPRLSDELDRGVSRFDRLGGRDLDLDQVLGRARGIRRRRRRTALVAVAAVAAAIAVPSVLLTRTHDDAAPDPARRLPTIDRIGLPALSVGEAPRTGWLQGSTWHGPDGKTLKISANVHEIARLGDGVIGVQSDESGNGSVVVVRGDGRVDQLGAVSGGLATSARGGVVAFVNPGGEGTGPSVTTVQGSEATEVTLEGLPAPGPYATYDAVTVAGEDCREGHQCAVRVNDDGKESRVLTAVTPGMDVGTLTGLELLAGENTDGLAAGYTRLFDGGSCSRVQDAQNAPLWHTCDARFLSFSPDGRHLLGSAAYADGFGDTELKTFDARTGEPGLGLRTTDGATITQMRWEDDDHVLVTVYEDHRWGVLRIGLDRTVEYAIAPVAGTTDESPVLLPD